MPAATLQFPRMFRLFRKELRENLRDRRTLVTLLLMPVLVYPLLLIVFQQLAFSQAAGVAGEDRTQRYLVAVRPQDDADEAVQYLDIGQRRRIAEQRARDEPADVWIAEVVVAADLEQALTAEGESRPRVDVALRVGPEGWPRRGSAADGAARVEILYNAEEPDSVTAAEELRRTLEAAGRVYVEGRFRVLGWQQPAQPFFIREIGLGDPNWSARASLAAIIPLVLILMTITGTVYPAIDLTAGERERGTLEVLVAAPLPRLELLTAKYLVVVVVAMLTATLNVTSMWLTMTAGGLGSVLGGGESAGLALAPKILFLLLLFAAFFSAVVLAVASFARSFKEAQAYLVPLMLLAIIPGVVGLLPGVELAGPAAAVPLLNIVLLTRDLLLGQAALVPALVTVASTLVYAAAAVIVAAWIFGQEAVLFAERGALAALFSRKTSRPRAYPTAAEAMLLLAVAFPLYFYVQAVVGAAPDVAGRLLLAAVIAVVVFLGLPVAAAWYLKVDARATFRLGGPHVAGRNTQTGTRGGVAYESRPVTDDSPLTTHGAAIVARRAAVWVAAILLGLGLWPLMHELIVLQYDAGILSSERFGGLAEEMEPLLAELRSLPLWLVVLAIALVPAVSEEVFFRGFLLSGLAARGRNDELEGNGGEAVAAGIAADEPSSFARERGVEVRAYLGGSPPPRPCPTRGEGDLSEAPARQPCPTRGEGEHAPRSGEGGRAVIAALACGLLFGLFHVVAMERLLPERFATSTVMGCVLAAVCLRTGSLWPGMLIHALHNSSPLVVGHVAPSLAERGIMAESATQATHLPAWLWLTSLVLCGVAGGVVVWATRRPSFHGADEALEVGRFEA